MVESFENEANVPEEFKNEMLKIGIQDDKLIDVLVSNPRSLFDFFDTYDVLIEICISGLETRIFSYKIHADHNSFYPGSYNKRIEVEIDAVEKAFELLDNKLKLLQDDRQDS